MRVLLWLLRRGGERVASLISHCFCSLWGRKDSERVSDFKIAAVQRQRLLAGDYRPMMFDTKPCGCDPGAVYVLARARRWDVRDGKLVRTLPEPVWFITVTQVLGGPKGRLALRDPRWLVKFDVVDRRHQERYMRRWPLMPELAGGEQDYTSSPVGAVDQLPVPDWTPGMTARAKTVAEFDHQRRLARFAEERRERSKSRRKRAA